MINIAEHLVYILTRLSEVLYAFAQRPPRAPYVVVLGHTTYVVPPPPEPMPPLAPAMLALIHHRFHRMTQRLRALFARWEAGELPKPLYDFPRPKPAPRAPRPEAYIRLPDSENCLAGRIFEVRAHASQLGHLMQQPDFARFLAEAPQAMRMLRPWCRRLGTPIPPAFRRPAPLRRPRPARPRRTLPPPLDPPLQDYVRRAASAMRRRFGKNA